MRRESFSEEVAAMRSDSIRPEKNRLDEAKWHIFAICCNQGLINVNEAAINTVTEFQASKRSLAPSTLEGYCSAIADTIRHVRGRKIVMYPCIKGLLKKCYL